MIYSAILSVCLVFVNYIRNGILKTKTERNKMKNTSFLIASDIHEVEGKSHLPEVLALFKDMSFSLAVFGGDNAGLVGGGAKISPEERAKNWQPVYDLRDIRCRIHDVLGKETECLFTYGSHDLKEINGISSFFSGPKSFEGFHVYGISHTQMHFENDAQTTLPEPKMAPLRQRFAREDTKDDKPKGPPSLPRFYNGIDLEDKNGASALSAIRVFKKWLEGLTDCCPVFVISHLPLHAHRGDNLGAAAWTAAFNEAAKKHDVFVFFAHNHSAEDFTDTDRKYYLAAPGNTMPVQGSTSEEVIETEIDFTYMNAGYIARGCATAVKMEDTDNDGFYDTVTFTRRCLDPGENAFGSTGINSPYTCKLR